jgi:hypothetical protein
VYRPDRVCVVLNGDMHRTDCGCVDENGESVTDGSKYLE